MLQLIRMGIGGGGGWFGGKLLVFGGVRRRKRLVDGGRWGGGSPGDCGECWGARPNAAGLSAGRPGREIFVVARRSGNDSAWRPTLMGAVRGAGIVSLIDTMRTIWRKIFCVSARL